MFQPLGLLMHVLQTDAHYLLQIEFQEPVPPHHGNRKGSSCRCQIDRTVGRVPDQPLPCQALDHVGC